MDTDDTIKLAQSCSTCKFARFKASESYFSNRRNTGLCLLNIGVDVEVPKITNLFNSSSLRYDLVSVLKSQRPSPKGDGLGDSGLLT